MMNISVVIPSYNEEKTIGSVICNVREVLEKTDFQFEIIVIDDASVDSTCQQAQKCGVSVISHKSNKGYGRSLKDGIQAATCRYVLIMDADGQHNPHDILKLLEYAEEYDMVVGARVTHGSNYWRLPGKWFLNKLCNYLSRSNIPDINSGLRIFKKDVIQQYLHLCSDGFSFTTSSTLAFLADGRDIKYVEIDIMRRQQGKSRVTLKTGLRTILLILQIVMVFHPLRFFLPINFVIGIVALLYVIWDITNINISDTSMLLLVTTMGIFFFSLIADQIAKLRRELQSKR